MTDDTGTALRCRLNAIAAAVRCREIVEMKHVYERGGMGAPAASLA